MNEYTKLMSAQQSGFISKNRSARAPPETVKIDVKAFDFVAVFFLLTITITIGD